MAPVRKIDIDHVLSKLSLDQKSSLLAGSDFWHSTAIPEIGIDKIRLSDGPNGVRGTKFFNGTPSSCVPCGVALGATFDVSLVQEIGRLLGEECRQKGVHVLLGPTMNIQRSPLNGRGFESFSEDSVVTGEMAAAYCLGVEDNEGVGGKRSVTATPKHFVCNEQEDRRIAVDTLVTQRALRETYLKPFQIALRKGHPGALMTSYNKVNGVHAAEDTFLLQEVVRKEWNWQGLVVSDWFGTYSVSEGVAAGQDIEMPGPARFRSPAALAHAVSSNKLSESVLDDRVRRVLEMVNRAAASDIPAAPSPETYELTSSHQRLLRRAAGESIVLLKNEQNVLPLRRDKSVAVIGPNANVARYCGGGSSSLDVTYAVSPLDGIRNQVDGGDNDSAKVRFSQGAYSHQDLPLIGDKLVTTDKDGQTKPGFSFRVYYDAPEAESREFVEEHCFTKSEGFLMDYADLTRFRTLDFYVDMEGDYTPDEDGLYDFGVCVCGTGRLYIDDQLVVDNATKQVGGRSFFGSGTREERGSIFLRAGQTYRLKFLFGSSFTSNFERRGAVAFGPGGFRFGGCRRLDPDQAIRDAVDVATAADQVVLLLGLSAEWECEGYDRASMELPFPSNNDLAAAILAARPDAVVVLQSGSPLHLPWVEKASTLLQAWYGGNEVGNGIADVLFGVVNPAGKLPFSYPARLCDSPAYLNFGSQGGRVLYGEDVFVGYKYYEAKEIQPLFPFGHGLSYTQFSLSSLVVERKGGKGEKEKDEKAEDLIVSVKLKNVGVRDGAEVVLVYVVPPKTCSVPRPPRELAGFTKVFLAAGKEQTVEVSLPLLQSTSYWNETRNAWTSEAGDYAVLVSAGGKELRAVFRLDKTTHWRGL